MYGRGISRVPAVSSGGRRGPGEGGNLQERARQSRGLRLNSAGKELNWAPRGCERERQALCSTPGTPAAAGSQGRAVPFTGCRRDPRAPSRSFPASCSVGTSRMASLCVCLFRYFWHGSRPAPAAAGAAAGAGGARRCSAGDPRRMRGCGGGTEGTLRAAPCPVPLGARVRPCPG